ncbi:unnamed protein product [Ilex paraguariensis]|uniref:Uncharacterized protein n=1 Tax=Ilex paraguariensis TaxID=185542 RepID=A0ABC8RQZ8_9AQUA
MRNVAIWTKIPRSRPIVYNPCIVHVLISMREIVLWIWVTVLLEPPISTGQTYGLAYMYLFCFKEVGLLFTPTKKRFFSSSSSPPPAPLSTLSVSDSFRHGTPIKSWYQQRVLCSQTTGLMFDDGEWSSWRCLGYLCWWCSCIIEDQWRQMMKTCLGMRKFLFSIVDITNIDVPLYLFLVLATSL